MDEWFRERATLQAESAREEAGNAACSGGPLRVVRVRSIHDVPEEVWDSLNAPVDLYHTHRFIRALEDACAGPRFWYLLFYQGDRLAATAALSAFTVRLDLFLDSKMRRLINALRRCLPSLLLLRVLFCGLPVSIGKHALAIASWMNRAVVLRRLVEEMNLIALEANVQYLCVKEFLEHETPAMDELCREGFVRAESLPYARMELHWRSFEKYLQELRYGYRRQILHSLKKLNGTNVHLVIGGPEVCPPATFHELYLQVLRRAEVTLETLPLQFFERLYENLAGELVVFALVQNGKILGAALCAAEERCLTFLLVGLDYAARDAYDVYFNLVYAITRSAIMRGCTGLDLGQTSYGMKSRIGAKTTRQFFYLRAQRRATHRIIEILCPVLFPGVSIPERRVLKNSRIAGSRPGQGNDRRLIVQAPGISS